jgi:hypothetical protein
MIKRTDFRMLGSILSSDRNSDHHYRYVFTLQAYKHVTDMTRHKYFPNLIMLLELSLSEIRTLFLLLPLLVVMVLDK